MGELFEYPDFRSETPWTGERLASGAGLQVETEHLHRYFAARELCRGLDVLDIASGEGYGSALLARVARSVVGVDSDEASIRRADASYRQENLRFLNGDIQAIPLPDASIDVVVCFETIEHLHEHDAALAELRRVMRPGGRLMMSTPERDTYSPAGAPPNPFHVRELTRSEFGDLLGRHFQHVEVFGQRTLVGSALGRETGARARGLVSFERRGERLFEASVGLPRAVYLVAVASDAPLDPLPESLLIERSLLADPLAEQLHARLLQAERSLADMAQAEAASRREATDLRGSIESERQAREQERALRQSVERHRDRIAADAQAAADRASLDRQGLTREIEALRGELARGRGPLRRLKAALASVRPKWRGVRKGIKAKIRSTYKRPPPPVLSPRQALDRTLQSELAAFLASGQRLQLPRPEQPAISVLIILWNKAHYTYRCLRSLLEQDDRNFEVILVDNGSTDETAALLERLDGVKQIRNRENLGFLLANNLAARQADGRHLLLLNSDAFPRPGALAAALQTLDADASIGAVGGRLVLTSGLLQEAGSIVWSDGGTHGYLRDGALDADEAMFRRDVDYCSGAFLLTPRAVWERFGGFDERYVPAYYEESDYCLRLWEAGLRTVYEPGAVVDHIENGSESRSGEATELMLRNRQKLVERHGETLATRHFPPDMANVLRARTHSGAARGRLLFVDDVVPLQSFGAGMPRARAMLAGIAAENWQVTAYPMQPQPETRARDWAAIRREIPADVEIVIGSGLAGLAAFLAERAGFFDAILVSRPHNMHHLRGIMAARPDLFEGLKIVYDAEALASVREVAAAELAGKPLSEAAAADLVRSEIGEATRGADLVTCVALQEEKLLRQHVGAGVSVHRLAHEAMPNRDGPSFEARRGFLFIGRLLETDAPNWQGLSWFVRECWPLVRQALPDATLSIVGQLHPDHAELQAPGVTLVGALAELEPAYRAARVFVAPVRFAAGIPLKVIEASAAGLPTAATSLMARQLGWQDAGALQAADEPAALAAAAIALHEDPQLWAATREHALQRVEAEYAPDVFRTRLADALSDLEAGRGDPRPAAPSPEAEPAGGGAASGAVALRNVQQTALRSLPLLPYEIRLERNILSFEGFAATAGGEAKLFVNGIEADQVEFPLPVPEVSQRFGLADGTAAHFRARLSTGAAALHAARFWRFDLSESGLPDGSRWRQTIYFMNPACERFPIPPVENMARVIGDTSVTRFAMGGAMLFKNIENWLVARGLGWHAFPRILDWGCGVGRLTRYLISETASQVTGADIDASAVSWCRANLPGGHFELMPLQPPSSFAAESFDLVVAISVLTHLRRQEQDLWLAEMQRISRPGALLFLSIRGATQLAHMGVPAEAIERMEREGFVDASRDPILDGVIEDAEYYRSILHARWYIRQHWGQWFEVEAFEDGLAALQDFVVLRRR